MSTLQVVGKHSNPKSIFHCRYCLECRIQKTTRVNKVLLHRSTAFLVCLINGGVKRTVAYDEYDEGRRGATGFNLVQSCITRLCNVVHPCNGAPI